MLHSCIIIVTIAIGTIFWAIQGWANPVQPIGLFIAGLLFAFAGRYGYWQWEVKIAEGDPERDIPPAPNFTNPIEIGCAVICLGAVLLWAVPNVRAKAVSVAATQGRLNVEKALWDGDAKVRAAACLNLLNTGIGTNTHQLMRMFKEYPESGKLCLLWANHDKATSAQYASETALMEWLLHMVRATSDHEQARACEAIEPVFVVGDAVGQPQDMMVLQCALGATAPSVRACCAKGLAARGQLPKTLGAPAEFNTTISAAVFRPLARASFSPKMSLGEADKLVEHVNLQDPVNKRWVADLACVMLSGDSDNKLAALKGLAMFVDDPKRCGVEDRDARLAFANPEQWGPVCQVLGTRLKTEDAGQSLCVGIRLAVVDIAITEAKERVHNALRMARYSTLGNIGDIGRLDGNNGGAGFISSARRKAYKEGRIGMKDLTRREYMALFGAAMPGYGGVGNTNLSAMSLLASKDPKIRELFNNPSFRDKFKREIAKAKREYEREKMEKAMARPQAILNAYSKGNTMIDVIPSNVLKAASGGNAKAPVQAKKMLLDGRPKSAQSTKIKTPTRLR